MALGFEDLLNIYRFPKQTRNAITQPKYQVSSEEWNVLVQETKRIRDIAIGGAEVNLTTFEIDLTDGNMYMVTPDNAADNLRFGLSDDGELFYEII